MSNNQLLSADLGVDKVFQYTYNSNNSAEPLQPSKQAFVDMPAGNGPRHITFNKKGNLVYVIGELDATISVYNYINNELSPIQRIDMNESGFTGTNGAADLHLSHDGKFLYATNRGSANEIVIFKVNDKDGKLTKIGSTSSLGKAPRNFAIDPTDKFLLVAHQDSDDIFVFERNQNTGLLKYTGTKLELGSPVCLIFASKE